MKIVTDPRQFQDLCWSWRCQGLETALVPTMGYLHQGHLSLMTWAKTKAQKVMVSVFVNPTQFGPSEDLDRYPRDPENDAAKAESAGVDVLYLPEAKNMYPAGFATSLKVSGLTAGLCGRSRPGHFEGVALVVTKLLMLAQPTMAVFGEKDWQQLAVIRRLVADLDFPVRVMGRPIFREPDGLAMSSRNVNLTAKERTQAPAIQAGLAQAKTMAASQTRAEVIINWLREFYSQNLPAGKIDYIECVHPETIEPVSEITGSTLLAVAVQFGRARLIDNVLLEI